jgi:hypothetical protein
MLCPRRSRPPWPRSSTVLGASASASATYRLHSLAPPHPVHKPCTPDATVILILRPATCSPPLRGGAPKTSSQILLSRGVAGTKFEPALPSLELDPSTRRLSLTIAVHTLKQTTEPTSVRETHIPMRNTSSRITKPTSRKDRFASGLRRKSRVAFHKYLTLFLTNSDDSITEFTTSSSRSRASSFGTRPNNSLQGSVPSVDFVSPAAFMFSRPSLQSSTCRLISFPGTSSDVQYLRHAQTDSFSMLDDTIQTLPDITIRAFTQSSKCKSWRLRNYVDPVVRTKQYVCRNRIVHNRVSVDQDEDIVMKDEPQSVPNCIAFNLPVRGDKDERPQVERSVILGFDANDSGVIELLPKALSIENND